MNEKKEVGKIIFKYIKHSKCPICNDTGINTHIERDELGLKKEVDYPCQCKTESDYLTKLTEGQATTEPEKYLMTPESAREYQRTIDKLDNPIPPFWKGEITLGKLSEEEYYDKVLPRQRLKKRVRDATRQELIEEFLKRIDWIIERVAFHTENADSELIDEISEEYEKW